MYIFSGTKLSAMADEHPKIFQELLPELIKKLIFCNSNNIKAIRMPSKDDIWSPGFDGIVESEQSTTYVCAGKSVWEFGTNKDSLKKINKDWEKRNQNSLGIIKSETEIYFVVTRIWAYDNQGCSISEWETEHRQDWKQVHVYDATILSDWINSEPDVCAWLLEQLGEVADIDFATVSTAWERFSSKTSPAFSHSLFLEGRDSEVQKFSELLNLSMSIIRVQAEMTLDSFGFCLSVILKNVDLANTVIVINNQNTYKNLSQFCSNKIFLLNCQLDCDVIPKNRAILCYNKEDQSVQADVKLRPLTKSAFDKAIKDMNIPEFKSIGLYENTHGNLLTLMRKISGNTTMSKPRWSNSDRISLLEPLLLLRNYDMKNKNDCDLISYLAGEKYDIIYEKYYEWSRLEDSPIKIVDNHIILINFEEAWRILNLRTNSMIFTRLINAICDICSNKYFVENNSVYLDLRTKSHIHNLFFDLICFSYNEDDKECIEQSVARILDITPFSPLILEHLSFLATAAPKTIMNFLEKDISISDGMVSTAFESDEYSIDYCKILFALDELVIQEDTGIRACNFLYNLCIKTRDREFANSNSPRESLLTALCLWHDRTVLNLSEKVLLIKRYLSYDEVYFIPFIIDLLLKESVFHSVRNGEKAFANMIIDNNALLNAMDEVSDIAFQKSIESHNIVYLKKLLAGYCHFNPNILMSTSSLFASTDYIPEELVPLNAELRERAYYANQNVETKPWLPALDAWINATTPLGLIGEVGWLFFDYYHCHYSETTESDDWNENQKKVENKRIEILKTLLFEHSMELLSLIQCSTDDTLWGYFYARELPSEILYDFAEEAIRLQKKRLLYGLLDCAKKEDCIYILNTFSIEEQNYALQSIYRQDILDWINTEEKETAYWMHQCMRKFDSTVYSKLLVYNPFGLLSYFLYYLKTPLSVEMDKIFQVFNVILSLEVIAPDSCYSYEICEIIAKLDNEGYYSEKWAKICVILYERNWLSNYPNALKRYYFENPHLLCEAEKHFTEKTYFQFYFDYVLPTVAYNDKNKFDFFVKTIIDNHTDNDQLLSILGNILGKGPNGSDGIFPHEFIRDAFELYRDYRLNYYVMIGKSNSREARSVIDGTQEREFAQKLKNDAKKLEILFPETAQLLRWLSDTYAAEGKRDRLFSEIGMGAM